MGCWSLRSAFAATLAAAATALGLAAAPVLAQADGARTYETKPGDTLSTIALTQYGDLRAAEQIYEANADRLTSPNVVPPGTQLVIPRRAQSASSTPRGTLRLTVGGSLAPFVGDDLPEGGMAADIVRTVMDRLGYDVELYDFGTWSNAAKVVRRAASLDDFVAGFPYISTPEREISFELSEPIVQTPFYAFMRADEAVAYRDDADFEGLVFCKQASFPRVDTDRISSQAPISVIEASSTEVCMRRLLIEESVDVVTDVLVDGATAMHAVTEDGGVPGCVLSRPVLGATEAAASIMFGDRITGEQDLLRDVNTVIRHMRDSGELEVIAAQHQLALDVPVDPCASGGPAPGARRVALVTAGDYQPFTDKGLLTTDDEAYNDGLATYVIDRIMERAGYDAAVDFADSWDDALKATQDEEYVGTFPWFDSADKREAFLYSEPIFPTPIRVFSRPHDFIYRGDDDLIGRRLCMEESWTIPARILELIDAEDIALERRSTMSACFERIRDKQADFTLVNSYAGWWQIRSAELDRDNFCIQERPVVVFQSYLILPRTQEARTVLRDFNASLADFKNSGELTEMETDYYRTYQNAWAIENDLPWVCTLD